MPGKKAPTESAGPAAPKESLPVVKKQKKVDPDELELRNFAKAANKKVEEEKHKQTKAAAAHEQRLKQQYAAALAQQQQMERFVLSTNLIATRFTELTRKEWIQVGPDRWLRFRQFSSVEELSIVSGLYDKHLTEPYSIFTYRGFCGPWPDLTIFAYGAVSAEAPSADITGEVVASITSRVSRKTINHPLRGYIAMLGVETEWRRFKIATELVTESINLMKRKGCTEVVLETPIYNVAAQKLYLSLGFVKTKFLSRYYMDGGSAVRLKLWLPRPRYVDPRKGDTGAADAEPAAAAAGN